MLLRCLPVCLAIIALMWNSVRAVATTLQDTLRVSWNQQSISSLQKLLSDRKTVQGIVSEIIALEPNNDEEERANDTPDVVEYKFVDLSGDGSVQLVCTLDYSGREHATVLMIINYQQGRMETAYLYSGGGGVGMGQLGGVIQDINGDGRNEVVMSYALVPFISPMTPTPYMEHIYVYRSGALVQADREFIDYYRTRLAVLRQDIDLLSQHAPPSNASAEEHDDYQRILDAKQKESQSLTKLLSEP
jgi:hypothetical protein